MEENDNNKNSIDEKTLKLQRRQRLEILIEKRKNNFNYLQEVQEYLIYLNNRLNFFENTIGMVKERIKNGDIRENILQEEQN